MDERPMTRILGDINMLISPPHNCNENIAIQEMHVFDMFATIQIYLKYNSPHFGYHRVSLVCI